MVFLPGPDRADVFGIYEIDLEPEAALITRFQV
jgi:hypothetical protein